jgi:hypothetical protein
MLVDHARRQLLAATRFSVQIDGCLAARHAPDQLAHFRHGSGIPDQRIFVPGRYVLRQLRQIERGAHQGAQLIERHGLRQVIEGAGLEGGNRIFHAAVRGDHRHRKIKRALADFPHQLQALAVGQPHVGQA